MIFYDAKVLLGNEGEKQAQKPLRIVGYVVDGTKYWIATDRFDLTADEIALIYKLRWEIEKFFGWWKRHLRVYHFIARNKHDLMVQILSGLITHIFYLPYTVMNSMASGFLSKGCGSYESKFKTKQEKLVACLPTLGILIPLK